MAPKLSAEQLALLSDEEREGLLDTDLTEEGEPGSEADDEDDDAAGGDDTGSGDDDDDTGGGDDADAGDDEDSGDAGDGKDETDGADKAAAAADDAGAAAADDAGADDGGDDADADEQPPAWIVPNDLPEKMEEIDKKRDELAAKFDEGELTAVELREQMKPLDKEYRDLERRQDRAELAKEQAIDDWKGEVSAFFDENTAYKSSEVLRDMLDKEVRRLQAEAVNPLNPKLLERAHKNIAGEVKKAFGIDMPTDKGKKDDPGKTGGKKTPPKKRDDPPPTLTNVPAADATDTGDGGEFAYLDRLAEKDSIAYENELKKLQSRSPEKYDAYMAQG